MSQRNRSRQADRTAPPRGRGEAGPESNVAEKKWGYLRAVYAVNPGIPHYLDFPQPRD